MIVSINEFKIFLESSNFHKKIENLASNILYDISEMLCSKYARERYYYKDELIIVNNINEDNIKTQTKSEEDFFNDTLLYVQLKTGMQQNIHGNITTTKLPNAIQYVIRLNYSFINYRLEQIFNHYKGGTMKYKELINYVYKDLEHYYYGTLVHELQHAYDAYRSDNKYSKNKNNKQNDYNEYLNRQHEINARYSETLAILKNYYNNFSNIEDIEWNTFYITFKDNFKGWNILDEKNKKRLTNRLKVYFDSLK